jgi:hypothetical protein
VALIEAARFGRMIMAFKAAVAGCSVGERTVCFRVAIARRRAVAWTTAPATTAPAAAAAAPGALATTCFLARHCAIDGIAAGGERLSRLRRIQRFALGLARWPITIPIALIARTLIARRVVAATFTAALAAALAVPIAVLTFAAWGALATGGGAGGGTSRKTTPGPSPTAGTALATAMAVTSASVATPTAAIPIAAMTSDIPISTRAFAAACIGSRRGRRFNRCHRWCRRRRGIPQQAA